MERLILDKLSDVLDEKQKQNKVRTSFMQCQNMTKTLKNKAVYKNSSGCWSSLAEMKFRQALDKF
jgi:hypothetical protein